MYIHLYICTYDYSHCPVSIGTGLVPIATSKPSDAGTGVCTHMGTGLVYTRIYIYIQVHSYRNIPV